MSTLELKIYTVSMQPDIDAFYAECMPCIGFAYEPQSHHCDCVHITEVYQKNGQFWCLYDGEVLIGTVAVRGIDTVNKIAELKRLYVHPSRQRDGLGKMLFETGLLYAKDAGFKKICADTRFDRAASRHLMESHGFHKVPQYNNNAFAELFYEVELCDTGGMNND
jgi:N-acetylglutamate synthase-like GNAT family acetyltransferase